jgi:hypothetical protein
LIWPGRGKLILISALIALSVGLATTANVSGRQLWFAPLDWFVRPWSGARGAADYMALFQSPGDSVLSRINVFILNGPFLRWVSDDDLNQILQGLREHRVALALEGGLLTADTSCGQHVEGFGGQDTLKHARRLLHLGGDLTFFAMDEPAWYGHIFSGTNACHWTMDEIARNAAKNVAALKTIFPHIVVGDVEPVGSSRQGLIEDYRIWVDAFRRAAGQPLAFFHADVQWKQSWHVPLKELAALLRRQKIPLGVIYNGNDDDASDEIWIANAEAHYRAVEADPEIEPGQAIFQSWVSHPSKLFPDTDPGAFSHLLRRYRQWHDEQRTPPGATR